MASHQGIHPNAPPHDKQDEAKDRTRGWRTVPLVASPRRASLSRCPVLLVVPVAVPPHIARSGFPSRGGGNSRVGHIFRAVFLSSSYPPRLIASSVPRLSVPSGQASRQGKTAGDPQSRHRIPAPARHRPVSPLVSACGANGVSLTSVGSVSSPRFPVSVAWQGMASPRARSHHGKQAGRVGPSPFRPSCRRAESHRPRSRIGSRGPVIGTVGKQAKRRRSSSRPPASTPSHPPHRLISSSDHPPRSSCRVAGHYHRHGVVSKQAVLVPSARLGSASTLRVGPVAHPRLVIN